MSKARKMAESAVDAMLAKRGISKAYGASPDRAMLVSMMLPAAELAVKAEKIIKSADKSIAVLERQAGITDQALRQTEQAINAVEMLYRERSAAKPQFGPYDPGKFVRPYVNGSSHE